jgi:muramoyltetrapeptide carboxypeptidase
VSAQPPAAAFSIVPPALRPGDLIAVVAPSSPFEHVLAWAGLGWLARRYRVRFARGLFTRDGYLAGTDERRRGELTEALTDPEVRAVLAARGGYGASRFVHAVDWSALAASPRWLVGFSDITALHVEAARVGVASIHGPHLTALGRGDARTRAALVQALEEPLAPRVYEGLGVVREGIAAGPLFGGNLTMLHACAAAGRLEVPAGCVLLLEDVTERPYRLDRMLATLAAGGHLGRVGAVVLGDFTQCDPGPDGVTVDQVLREALGRLGVPVVRGVPVGHELRNDPVTLGGMARVAARGREGVLRLGRGVWGE